MIANLDLKVIDRIKKKSISVVDASLKTVRDNVKHNSSNFISFQEMDSGKNLNLNVPQFDNVVKYLLSYNYF